VRLHLLLSVLFLPPWTSASPAGAQGLSLALETVASDLLRPVVVAHAGDASGRLFIAEQEGKILVLSQGAVLETPFLDLSTLVTTEGNEQGLLGLAFHPAFAENGFFYVNYTEPEPNPPPDCPPPPADCDANTVVARYRVSENDPNLADPSSAQILLRLNQPRRNHNAGALAFGPDGYLYVALGDGGGPGDPYENAQDLGTLLGSILRIDVDGSPPTEPNDLCGPDPGYGLPSDNPFVDQAGACDEIWAYGLRNPWRFSFDRETGDLFIGDVGQNEIEEIDFQPATSPGGENYGWNCFEGSMEYDNDPPCQGPLEEPILEYTHDEGRAVTGGYRYRGDLFPQLRSVYFYADYAFGKIWGTVPRCDGVWESRQLLDEDFLISTFGEDEAGELYLTRFDPSSPTSEILHLTPAPGSGGPLLGTEPANVDFGPVPIDEFSTRELELTNDNLGPEALLLSSMTLSDTTHLQLDVSGGSQPCNTLTPCLLPGSSCTVSLTFSSPSAGIFAETLSLAGNTPDQIVPVTATAYVPCTAQDNRILAEESVSDTVTEEACLSLTAGPYHVLDGGNVTLRAGQRIVLRNGFEVLSGGRFTAEIDPLLTLP
jgi:glucose/arabinose dehydrogenase